MGVEVFQSTRIPRLEPKRTVPVGMTLGLRGSMLCGDTEKEPAPQGLDTAYTHQFLVCLGSFCFVLVWFLRLVSLGRSG